MRQALLAVILVLAVAASAYMDELSVDAPPDGLDLDGACDKDLSDWEDAATEPLPAAVESKRPLAGDATSPSALGDADAPAEAQGDTDETGRDLPGNG